MHLRRLLLLTFPASAALLILAGCDSPPHRFVAGDGEKFPRLRFAKGGVSPNDRCPVKKNKLNPRMDPMLVNGRPIGFC